MFKQFFYLGFCFIHRSEFLLKRLQSKLFLTKPILIYKCACYCVFISFKFCIFVKCNIKTYKTPKIKVYNINIYLFIPFVLYSVGIIFIIFLFPYNNIIFNAKRNFFLNIIQYIHSNFFNNIVMAF